MPLYSFHYGKISCVDRFASVVINFRSKAINVYMTDYAKVKDIHHRCRDETVGKEMPFLRTRLVM